MNDLRIANQFLLQHKLKSFPVYWTWSETTKQTTHSNAHALSRLTVELIIMHKYPNIYSQVNLFDALVGTKTPDVKYTIDNVEYIIEFKCLLKQPDKERVNAIEKENKRLYGENTETIIVIHGKHVPELYGFTREWGQVYRAVLTEYRSSAYIVDDDHPSSVNDCCREVSTHLPPSETFNIADISEDDLARQIIEALPKFEDNLNKSFLSTKEISSLIKETPKANLFVSRNPWNRDSNRAETILKGLPMWGHKAPFIQSTPVERGLPLVEQDYAVFSLLVSQAMPSYSKAFSFASKMNTPKMIRSSELIKKFDADIAFLSTTADKESIKDVAAKYNLEIEGRIPLINRLRTAREFIVGKIKNEMPGTLISKHGNPVLTLKEREKIGVDIRKDTVSEKPEDTQAEWADWENALSFLDGEEKPKEVDLCSNLAEAYLHNPEKDMCKLQYDLGADIAKQITTSKVYSKLMKTVHLYRALMAAIPKLTTKGWRSDELTIVSVPETNWCVITTPSPTKLTSGAMVFAYKWKGAINPGFANYYSLTVDETTYVVTKPLRLSQEWIVQPDLLYSKVVGAHTHLLANGVNLLHNELFNSCLFRQTSDVVRAFDTIYNLYKSTYWTGNFGKLEYEKKVFDFQYKDPRAVTMMYRLKKNLNDFVDGYERNLNFKGLQDPIFNFVHTGIQSFLSMGYLKQLGDKGGVDEKFKLGQFFVNETIFQEEYLKSKFGAARDPVRYTETVKDWADSVLHPDGTWEPLCYHLPGARRALRTLVSGAMSNDCKSPYEFFYKPVIGTSVNSKCFVMDGVSPLFQSSDPYLKKRIEELHGAYPGLTSLPQPEALYFEVQFMKQLIATEGSAVKSLFQRIQKTQNPSLKWEMSTLELAVAELEHYGPNLVTGMCLKDQVGWGKRAFFQQCVWFVTAFRCIEKVALALLEGVDQDLIHRKGPAKFMHIRARAKNIMRGKCVTTHDQRRFGDTYPLEMFHLVYECMCEEKFITPEVKVFCRQIIDIVGKRRILLPHQLEKSYRATVRDYGEPTTCSDREGKKISLLTNKSGMLQRADNMRMCKGSLAYRKLSDWPMLERNSGFILGALNDGSSVLAASAVTLKNMVYSFLRREVARFSGRLSDDGIGMLDCPPPPALAWKDLQLSKFTRELQRCPNVIITDQEVECRYDAYSTRFPSWMWAKLDIVLNFLTQRMVGTQPSKYKEGYGYMGEVMQAVIESDGTVNLPLIRHAVTFGAELPGYSYGEDLNSACTRVYEYVSNGGTMEGYAALLIFSNKLVREKYGVKKTYLYLPLSLFGIFFPLFHYIIFEGFASDEVRRLQFTVDDRVKRILTLCLATDDVWISRAARTNQHVTITDEISEDENLRHSCSYKQFTLCFSHDRKTSLAAQKIQFVFEDKDKVALSSRFDFIGQSTEELGKSLAIYSTVTDSSTALKGLSLIKKYKTRMFIDRYARVSSDTKIIHQMGYYKYKIPNPFSSKIRSLSRIFDRPSYRLKEIPELMFTLSAFKFDIPVSDVLFSYHEEALAPSVINCQNSCVQIYQMKPKIDAPLYVTSLARQLKTASSMVAKREFLALAYDILEYTDLKFSKLLSAYPSLGLDTVSVEEAIKLASTFRSKGVTSTILGQNFRMFLKILIPKGKNMYAFLPSSLATYKDVLSASFSHDQSLCCGSGNTTPIVLKKSNLSSENRLATMIWVSNIQLSRNTTNFTNFSFGWSPEKSTFATLESLHQIMFSRNFFDITRDMMNYWLVLCLSVGDDCPFYYSRERVGIRTKYCILSMSREKPFDVLIGSKPKFPSPQEVLLHMKLLSYFCLNKRNRLLSLQDIETSDTGEIYRFGDSLVVASSGQTGWTSLHMNFSNTPLTSLTNGKKIPYGYALHNNYCITPWSFSLSYTGARVFFNNAEFFKDPSDKEILDPTFVDIEDNGLFEMVTKEKPSFSLSMCTILGTALVDICGLAVPIASFSEPIHKVAALCSIQHQVGLPLSAIVLLIRHSITLPANNRVTLLGDIKKTQEPVLTKEKMEDAIRTMSYYKYHTSGVLRRFELIRSFFRLYPMCIESCLPFTRQTFPTVVDSLVEIANYELALDDGIDMDKVYSEEPPSTVKVSPRAFFLWVQAYRNIPALGNLIDAYEQADKNHWARWVWTKFAIDRTFAKYVAIFEWEWWSNNLVLF